MTKAKDNTKTVGATALSEDSLSRVHGGTRSPLTQTIVVKRQTAGDTSTATDDVFVDGNIITAENYG